MEVNRKEKRGEGWRVRREVIKFSSQLEMAGKLTDCRALESLTLRTTNGEKITIKNRQLSLATQAKYNLIALSVQVRFTVVQIYITLNPFMQSLYNITLQLYLQLLNYLADTSLSGDRR